MAVVAVPGLEVLDVMLRERQHVGGAGGRHQAQAHKLGATETRPPGHPQVAEQGHAVILDGPVPQDAPLVGLVKAHGCQQELPVRCDRRRAVAADVRQEFFALLVVRNRQDGAVWRQPLHAGQTMAALTVALPVGGIGAAKAVERLLDPGKGQPRAGQFHHQDHHVDVVEEIEIHVDDVEHDRIVLPRERETGARDVGAAEDTDGRLARPSTVTGLSVEETLDVRQERHELAVVPLLEQFGVGGELILDLAPRAAGAVLEEPLPGRRAVGGEVSGHELEGPQQDLVELVDDGVGRSLGHGEHLPGAGATGGAGRCGAAVDGILRVVT